jgi:hypothetical protein
MRKTRNALIKSPAVGSSPRRSGRLAIASAESRNAIKKMKVTAWIWPTRDEWAYSRQHPYWNSETGCPFFHKFKHRLSDYATQEEIAAVIAAVKAARMQARRAECEAHQSLGPLGRVLKILQCDNIPRRLPFTEKLPTVTAIIARYEAAFEAVQAEWQRECEQRPIDDTAWERELERRRKLEEKWRNDALAVHTDSFRKVTRRQSFAR